MAKEKIQGIHALKDLLNSVSAADLEAIDAEDPLMTDFMQTDMYDDDPIPPGS